MPLPIESVTTAALSAALDAGSRRQAAIASNIANVSVDGFVPVRLSFEEQLAEARAVLEERGTLRGAGLEILRSLPEVEAAAGDAADTVQLDAEMAELARNAVHFQTLTQALARHLSLIALAADGRR